MSGKSLFVVVALCFVLSQSFAPTRVLAASTPSKIEITAISPALPTEGQAALSSGDPARAEELFMQAHKQSPSKLEPQIALALANQMQGNEKQARAWIQRALKSAPGNPAVLKAYAQLLYEQGATEAITPIYRKAMAEFPKRPQIRLDYANFLLEKLKKPGEAVAILEDLVSKNPELSAAHLSLGLALSAEKRTEEALVTLEEAARRESSNPLVHHTLGLVALRFGKYERALAAFERALALRADMVAAQLGRAEALGALGRIPQALESYQQAATLAPRSALPHAMRAQLLEQEKRMDEAETAYREGLAIEPGNPMLMNNLAFFLASRNQKLDEALGLARQSVKADPKRAAFLDTLGNVQLARNDYPAARANFEKALKLEPSNAVYQRHLAQSLGKPPTAQVVAALKPNPKPVPVIADADKSPVAAMPAAKPAETVKAMNPPSATANATKPAVDDPALVLAPRLEAWRQAWEGKDANRYLAFYARDFEPADKRSRVAWEAERRSKLDKKGEIRVRIVNPAYSRTADVVSVVFEQHYSSSNFSDKMRKQIDWVRDGEQWRIHREIQR